MFRLSTCFLLLISMFCKSASADMITTFALNITQSDTAALTLVQNLSSNGVNFVATLNLTANTSSGGSVGTGTVGSAGGTMNFVSGASGGVGVNGSDSDLLNANEAIQANVAISSVSGGQVSFGGFRRFVFSSFDADDSAVFYTASKGTLITTVNAVSDTSVDLSAIAVPYSASNLVLFGNTSADRNGSGNVSKTSFRLFSLQASFEITAVPEPSTAVTILLSLAVVLVVHRSKDS